MPEQSAVRTAHKARATAESTARQEGSTGWTRSSGSLAVRLAIVLLAVVATLAHLGPFVQTPLWLAAATAVAIGFFSPGEGVDWMGRSLGLGVAVVILLGTALDAVGFALTSQVWAIALGLLAMGTIALSHRRALTRGDRRPASDPAGTAETGSTARGTVGPAAVTPTTGRRLSLVWGAAAALVAVAALAWAGISGRPAAPDMEMWLTDPAQATATAPAGGAPAPVKVSVRSGVDVSDARLTVSTGAQDPAAAAAAPAQQFSVGAGQTVEQTVPAPAGHVEIRLTSASRPDLNRVLVLNR